MKKHFLQRTVVAFAGACVMLAAANPVAADDASPAPAGIAFHYVGRVKLNFTDSTGIVYGYITTLPGLPSSAVLFKGMPGETTALLTFRANVKLDSLPPNGGIGPGQFAVLPFLVQPGSWSIYFTPNPSHNWDDPDTFSNGQAVATLERGVEQFSVYPTFSINAGAAALQSTSTFPLAGRTINFREIAPLGIVDITSGTPVPLSGSTATSPIFAVAGYSLAAAR